MEKTQKYDSAAETQKHKDRVAELIGFCTKALQERAFTHDDSKLGPIEKPYFDEYTPKLKDLKYGTPEYQKALDGLKPALDHHYAVSRHHPEHFSFGIEDMNLIDLIEMMCDWKAASERHKTGDVYESVELNKERFGYSDELASIFKNTLAELKGK